jgi:uncharacterized protein Yka (UPF0111/DUF47 family)
MPRGPVAKWWRARSRRSFRSRTDLWRLFARAGANLQSAAEDIHELLVVWPEDRDLRSEITAREQEGDRITERIIRTLHETRLTAYDRGGAYALAEAIDDVVDDIEEVSEEFAVYAIEAPMEQAQQLGSVVRDAGRTVRRALDRFRDGDDIEPETIEIRDIEHEGDRIYRAALVALFEGGIDPIQVIRWKDIFEGLENTIDRARQAMDILHGLELK